MRFKHTHYMQNSKRQTRKKNKYSLLNIFYNFYILCVCVCFFFFVCYMIVDFIRSSKSVKETKQNGLKINYVRKAEKGYNYIAVAGSHTCSKQNHVHATYG